MSTRQGGRALKLHDAAVYQNMIAELRERVARTEDTPKAHRDAKRARAKATRAATRAANAAANAARKARQ